MAILSHTQTLDGMFTREYERSQRNYFESPYAAVVHPLTFKRLQDSVKKLKETNMPTYPECKNEVEQEETPLQRELNHRKYQVRDLRANIARKQEELRIALALLAAVKKLDKGGK